MPSHQPRTERTAAAPARLFVDSGAWIALRSRRDQHHADADRLFRQAIQRHIPLVTTNLVIAETHRLTLFRAGVQAAWRALDRIDASPSVAIHFPTAEHHAAARRWLERVAPRPLTYTDAVSFAVMEATACRYVLGFDQDFAAAGFTLWRGSGSNPQRAPGVPPERVRPRGERANDQTRMERGKQVAQDTALGGRQPLC